MLIPRCYFWPLDSTLLALVEFNKLQINYFEIVDVGYFTVEECPSLKGKKENVICNSSDNYTVRGFCCYPKCISFGIFEHELFFRSCDC